MSNGEGPHRTWFGDGSFVEYEFTRVPESPEYPEGVKYGFQYVGPNGTPILRYDNSHGVHERHHGPDAPGERIRYSGSIEGHLKRFMQEVRQIRRRNQK